MNPERVTVFRSMTGRVVIIHDRVKDVYLMEQDGQPVEGWQQEWKYKACKAAANRDLRLRKEAAAKV